MTTHRDLETLILKHLAERGASKEYARGYLDAMRLGGYLKPTAPHWIRESAANYYRHQHPPCTPPKNPKP